MRTLYPLIAAVAAALTLAQAELYAQSNNPLDFTYSSQRIGIDIGLSSTWQTGLYTARCGRFEKGAKMNPIVGLTYDYPLSDMVRFEMLGGYQSRSLHSTYNSRENVVMKTQDNQLIRVDVDFENVGDARFAYMFLMPSLRWNPTKIIVVGAGVNAGFLLGAKTQYTKNIISRVVNAGDLNLAEVSYPSTESSDPYSKVFAEEDRPDAAGFGADAVAYVGAEFRPVKSLPKLKITPRVMYTFPLTPVLDSPDVLKLNNVQILIGLRWNLSSLPQ